MATYVHQLMELLFWATWMSDSPVLHQSYGQDWPYPGYFSFPTNFFVTNVRRLAERANV